jgi:hypothetical protein
MNETSFGEQISSNYTTSVSINGICYQALFNEFPFHETMQSVIEITTANISLPSDHYFNRFLEVDFLGRNKTGLEVTINSEKDVTTDTEQPMYVAIRVDSVFRSLPIVVNGKARCSETISQDNCRAQCRVNLIQKLCNCLATS